MPSKSSPACLHAIIWPLAYMCCCTAACSLAVSWLTWLCPSLRMPRVWMSMWMPLLMRPTGRALAGCSGSSLPTIMWVGVAALTVRALASAAAASAAAGSPKVTLISGGRSPSSKSGTCCVAEGWGLGEFSLPAAQQGLRSGA